MFGKLPSSCCAEGLYEVDTVTWVRNDGTDQGDSSVTAEMWLNFGLF